MEAVLPDVSDQHPLELGADEELLGRTVEDPLRRANLAEPPHCVSHSLERVRPANILRLDNLALQREQVDEHALSRGYVSHGGAVVLDSCGRGGPQALHQRVPAGGFVTHAADAERASGPFDA